MLRSKTRWVVRSSDKMKSKLLEQSLNLTPLVSSLLINRGIETVDSARYFLFESKKFHDPFLLPDMEKAVTRIKQAIQVQEKILIYGDYDADGVTSTALLLEALLQLNANVDYYIPNRFSEGYGPNEEAFKRAARTGVSLIITVDTGISALHEAIVAKQLNMDLIITDHHEPGEHLPEAFAIIHPKRFDSSYPFRDLAGVGVSFKLATALLGKIDETLLDLAAIGTIADLVPLLDENRMIAKSGIEQLKRTKRPGLIALMKKSGIQLEDMNEDTIGFGIAPRINAVGRLSDATPAIQLLISKDPIVCKNLADEIDEFNKKRQSIVQELTEKAIQQALEICIEQDHPVIIVGDYDWHPGVIGIVASKLVEKFYRPVIVFSFDRVKKEAKGSARSIPGFDLYENLSKCKDILPHFGGHPMAAGMTLKIEDVEVLRDRLIDLSFEQLSEEDFIPLTELDDVAELEDITLESIEQIHLLAPFGVGNPKPKFLVENIEIQSVKKIGADQSHLKATLQKDAIQIDAISFGNGDIADHISPFAKASIIGEFSINEWNNRRKPQVFLSDIKVEEWQLFDFRGNQKPSHWLKRVPTENRKIIVFEKETIEEIGLNDYAEDVIWIGDDEKAKHLLMQNSNVVLADLPPSKQRMIELFKGKQVERIYAHFYNKNEHFLRTFPTRDYFKWFYAFLLKRKTFDMNKHGDDLAKYRGWSKDTIEFMTNVFIELNIAKIEEGLITLTYEKQKRDLTESLLYQDKLEKYQLEQEFLYSNYMELKNWFDTNIYGVSENGRKLQWI